MRSTRTVVGMILASLILAGLLAAVGCTPADTTPSREGSSTSVGMSGPSPSSSTSTESFHLKVATGFPPGHTNDLDLAYFIPELEKRSGGRITTEVYEGTLGSTKEYYDMVRNGVVDIMMMGDAWAPEQFPLFAVNQLPFEYPNWWVMTSAMTELVHMDIFPEFDSFELLYLKPTLTMVPMLVDKKITKLEDFRGLTIRTSGGSIFTSTVNALGAAAKAMPGGDVYMALSTHQIDGVITGIDNCVDRKFYESCKYVIKNAPVFGGLILVLMNKDTWNKLPADLQLVVRDVSIESYYYFGRVFRQAEIEKWKEVETKGLMEIYSIAPEEYARWKEACSEVGDEWAAQLDAKGMQGSKVLQAFREVIARYTE